MSSDITILASAINILKGDGDGSFRGGDPEYAQQKKEEKQQEKEDTGDVVENAIKVLKASSDSGDEGSFRGGDPELLQQKKEEKREEQEALGDTGDDAGDVNAEEPDPADIEEEKQKEEDRLADAGKSFPFGLAEAGHEISPVSTGEDYNPQTPNGDPWRDGDHAHYPDIDPAPIRPGANQWRPWSEVLGFKIPQEGAPWQHIRRFIMNGEPPEVVQKERDMLVRSLEETFDMDKIEKAFFDLWDNLNRGLTFNPIHQIYKAEKGEMVEGHQYVHRSMGPKGNWEYSYTSTPHPENHGLVHTGNRQGHTIDVHPEWHSQGMDPTHTNPEGAFHHARSKAMEVGGVHKFKVHNPDTMQHENKVMHIVPGITQPINIYDDYGEDKPQGKPKRLKGFAQFEEYIRNNHVNTEHDIHGKPWLQWMDPSPRQGEKAARIKMRYFPGSPHARQVPQKTDKEGKGWFQGPSDVDALRRRVQKEKEEQLASGGLIPQKPAVKTFSPNPETPHTNKVHQGLPKKLVDVPYEVKSRRGNTEYVAHGVRKVPQVDWKNSSEKIETANGIYGEHQGLALHTAHQVMKELNQRRANEGKAPVYGKLLHDIVSTLSRGPAMDAVHRALNSYTPGSAKFTSYLHHALKGEQRKALSGVVKEHEAGTAAPSYDDEATQRKADAAVQSAPRVSESDFENWLQGAHEHVTNAYHKWLQDNPGHPETSTMYAHYKSAKGKLKEMEKYAGLNPEADDPDQYWAHVEDSGIHPMFHVPDPEDNADEISNHMRQAMRKSVDISKAQKEDKDSDKKPKPKSKSKPEQPAQPDVSYVGRHGDPGAFRYLYEASPGGNIVSGTNAPSDHEDHVPSLGEPVAHPNEPMPETNPELFDEQGRKLDRPVPPDAETNENYDPNKANGNFWVKRYSDPETGEMNYAYLHRDQILDPKMKTNMSIRYVDAQLPKIRQWYQDSLASEDPQKRALGLFIALLDQGRISLQDLESLTVGSVKMGNGNVTTFRVESGSPVKVVLDWNSQKTLQELLDGKDSDERVFSMNGQVLDILTINKFFNEQFGVSPSAIRSYGITLAFVREFHKIVSNKGKMPLEFIGALQDQVAQKVAKDFGVPEEEIVNYIDPIVSQAMMLSAFARGDSVSKSSGHEIQDHIVFQGLPVAVENKAGSVRKWYDKESDEHGETKMLYPYGYIKKTEGADGDQVDVYVGPSKDSDKVFVIHQMKKPDFKEYDEDKVMLGFDTAKDAKEAYLKHFSSPRFFGHMTSMSMKEFKSKVFKTEDHPGMIKSMVWVISSEQVNRTPEEEEFSQWLHKYPLHEHERHWNALTQHDENEEINKPTNTSQQIDKPQGLMFGTAESAPIAEAY